MKMQQQWDKPRRPSPVIFLTGFVYAAKESVGYVILAIVSTYLRKGNTNGDDNSPEKFPWLIAGLLAAVIILKFQKIFAWFFTWYWVAGNKVILKKGMFVKHQVELPFQKIQTIQIHQTMLHRLTQTCALTMDTAGSAKAEFVIEALKIDDARALKQFVRSQQQESHVVVKETIATEKQPLLTMRAKDFLKLCISENHLKSLALIATFVLGKAYDISQQLGLDSKRYIEEQSSGVAVSFWAIGILLSMALGIAILFSTIRVIIRFYDYRLQHTSTAFEISWGLFTRHRKTMPYAKVEFITWVANWLRQKMDMMVLRLHSLAESETEQALHIQMPVTNKKMFAHITDTYIPLLPAEIVATPAGIEKAYVYRKLLMIGLPITLIAGTLIWFYAGWHAGWVLLWLLYFAASQYTFYKNYRIWITEDAIQISRGIWGSEQVVIYLDKIVSVALHTSPYQRSNGYANMVLHLPGKSWVIPYLSKEQADYWTDYITMKIEA